MKWLPGSLKNKRISSTRQRKQQHLLDVKIRVGKERQRRARVVAGFIFKAAVFTGLVWGAWVGGKEGLRRFVWENPDYAVSDLRVTTDGTLTREQVLAASELIEGRNIFCIDLGKARSAIEKMPQVESAEVQRTLPNHVSVSITERRPIAWVILKKEEDPTTSDRSFLIDARSIVLRSRVLLPEYYHLPIISGVETENLVPGQRVNTLEMQAALELVRLNADSTRFQARNIDLAKGYCLVVTDQRRAKITFAFDGIDRQLARLNRLLDAVEPTHQEIQTVNLIPERNIPVTFRDLAAEAAAVVAEAEAAAAAVAPPKPEPRDSKGRVAVPGADKNLAKSIFATTKIRPSDAAKTPAPATPKPKAGTASPDRRSSPGGAVKKRFHLNG